jgi:hypothetical protein
MTTKVIVITLAVTITGGALALADGLKLQSANSANVHAMKMDRCPYYPPAPRFLAINTSIVSKFAHTAGVRSHSMAKAKIN